MDYVILIDYDTPFPNIKLLYGSSKYPLTFSHSKWYCVYDKSFNVFACDVTCRLFLSSTIYNKIAMWFEEFPFIRWEKKYWKLFIFRKFDFMNINIDIGLILYNFDSLLLPAIQWFWISWMKTLRSLKISDLIFTQRRSIPFFVAMICIRIKKIWLYFLVPNN